MISSQVVLITGGSSGLGKATGFYLKELGYRVYGTSRSPEKYSGHPFPLLQMDVQSEESVQEAIKTLLKKEQRIDVLVNNAGVGITGPLEETPHQAVLNAMETNFHGPLRVMQAVLPQMREQGGGFILNITSIAGSVGLPFRGIYSASKAALGVATEACRMEVRGFNIRMSTLAPGDYATNIASGRYHSPLREDSAYRETYGKSLELMDEHVSGGNDPLEVARKIAVLIRSERPGVHYAVGSFTQRLSLLLKRLLPDTWFEGLLRNHYKL